MVIGLDNIASQWLVILLIDLNKYDNIIPVSDQESNLSIGYFLGLTSITQFLPGSAHKDMINFLLDT